MTKKLKKSVILAFACVIVVACGFYAVFFVNRVIQLSATENENLDDNYKQHVIVAGDRNYLNLLQDFYFQVLELAPSYDAKVELLFPDSVADSRTIDDWIDYARFVCADGIILFCDDDKYENVLVKDVHNNILPIVISGPAKRDMVQMLDEFKVIVQKNKNWKKGVLFVEENYAKNAGEKSMEFLSCMKKIIDLDLKQLSANENREDELKIMLLEIAMNRTVDVVFCLTPEDTTLVSQLTIEMNLAGRFDIVGLLGDSKTDEYKSKGIVADIIYIDEAEMAADAMNQLFNISGGQL